MPRYVVLDTAGNVVNAIVWDGVTPYDPGAGANLVHDDAGTYQIGQALTAPQLATALGAKTVPVVPVGSAGPAVP